MGDNLVTQNDVDRNRTVRLVGINGIIRVNNLGVKTILQAGELYHKACMTGIREKGTKDFQFPKTVIVKEPTLLLPNANQRQHSVMCKVASLSVGAITIFSVYVVAVFGIVAVDIAGVVVKTAFDECC